MKRFSSIVGENLLSGWGTAPKHMTSLGSITSDWNRRKEMCMSNSDKIMEQSRPKSRRSICMNPSKILEFRLIIDRVTPKKRHQCFQDGIDDAFKQTNMSYLCWGVLSNNVFFKRNKMPSSGKMLAVPICCACKCCSVWSWSCQPFPRVKSGDLICGFAQNGQCLYRY